MAKRSGGASAWKHGGGGGKKGRRREKKGAVCFLKAFQLVGCHPEGSWIYGEERDTESQSCALPLAPQETAHHGLGRREFHTSQGYSVLGSTLTRPRGEINTPAGPRICVCVRAGGRAGEQTSMHTYAHTRARASVCTHSCVSSMTHIPIFPLQRKLVDPGMC